MASTYRDAKVVKVDGVWQIEGKPREVLQPVARYHPSNLPGKTILVALVDIPPGGATPAHRHGGAAALAFPFSGSSLNQMCDKEPKIYGPGEFFYEAPGCHHQVSENPSSTESAKFWAILIVDDETLGGKDGHEYGNLFVLDKEVEMGEKEASKDGREGCEPKIDV